jgi:predicted transposase YdaD
VLNITTESSYYRLAVREGRDEGLKEGRQEGLREGEERGLKEGRLQEARKLLLRLGQLRWGPPGVEIRGTIERIANLERLEQMSDRVILASGWTDLLAEPRS